MEGHRGDLEEHAHRQQGQGHGQCEWQGLAAVDHSVQCGGDGTQLGRAGEAEDEGQAEEEDGAAERPQQEVLDGSLGGEPVALGEARQQVARQHQQLQSEEEDEQVLAAGDEHAAADREQQRGRELRQRQTPWHQVVRREEQRQQADGDEHHLEQHGQQVAGIDGRIADGPGLR